MITHPEAAAELASDNVISLEALSPDHIGDALTAAEHTDGFFDSFGTALGFPILTCGFATAKEAKLAGKYGLDAGEAFSSVALKTGAVAVGIAAGVALGGPVGGILGAILARFAIGGIEEGVAKEKSKEFSSFWGKWTRDWDSSREEFCSKMQAVVENHQQAFELQISPQKDQARNHAERFQAELFGAMCRLSTACIHLFDRLDEGLARDLDRLNKDIPLRAPILRIIWPRATDYIGDLSRNWIAAKRAELRAEGDSVQKVLAEAELEGVSFKTFGSVSRQLARLAKQYDVRDEEIAGESRQFMQTLKELGTAADEALDTLMEQAEPYRQWHLREMERESSEIWAACRGDFLRLVGAAQSEWRSYARAQERAGLQVHHSLKPFEAFVEDMDRRSGDAERRNFHTAKQRIGRPVAFWRSCPAT